MIQEANHIYYIKLFLSILSFHSLITLLNFRTNVPYRIYMRNFTNYSIGLGNKLLQFVNLFCSMFLLDSLFLIDVNITECIFDLVYLYLI